MIEQFIDSRGPWFRWVCRSGRSGVQLRARHEPGTDNFAIEAGNDLAIAIDPYDGAGTASVTTRDLDELICALTAIRRTAERMNRLSQAPHGQEDAMPKRRPAA
jgi:hypothetical protein